MSSIPEYYTLELPKKGVMSKKLVVEVLLAICIISMYLVIYILSNQDVYQHFVNFIKLIGQYF